MPTSVQTALEKGIDWDDLRTCLAVGRAGTAYGAGLLLGVSHTTVLRRVAALEERLGLVLFHRRANGYEANEAGGLLIASAEKVESQIADTLASITGRDEAMRGTIRLAIPDITGPGLLEMVKAFCDQHPEISIALEVAQRPHTVTRGDAHVAIVLTASAPPGQMGAPIGPSAFAAYATKAALAESAPEELPWIGLDRSLYYTPVGRIDRRVAAEMAKVHQASSLTLHFAAVRSGLGVGLLPCSVGDSLSSLQRCGPTFCDPSLTTWVLHRRELRTSARVSAFARHMRQALLARKDLMAGLCPNGPARPFPALEALLLRLDRSNADGFEGDEPTPDLDQQAQTV